VPHVPGLDIQVGATQVIVPGAIYRSLFKLADGSLAVADRRSADAAGPGAPTGAARGCLPALRREIIQLGSTASGPTGPATSRSR